MSVHVCFKLGPYLLRVLNLGLFLFCQLLFFLLLLCQFLLSFGFTLFLLFLFVFLVLVLVIFLALGILLRLFLFPLERLSTYMIIHIRCPGIHKCAAQPEKHAEITLDELEELELESSSTAL